MPPKFFKSASHFHRWLTINHHQSSELWVGFYKKDSGRQTISYQEALDEALCFGWIDGVRKSVDDVSYTIRFTPRKTKSIWSAINIRRAKELQRLGLLQPAGLKAFAERDPTRSGLYSFENRPSKLDNELEKEFRAHKAAWEFFQAQPPGYRRTAIFWIMSAKKEETRSRRLAQLIVDSQNGKRLGIISSPPSQ